VAPDRDDDRDPASPSPLGRPPRRELRTAHPAQHRTQPELGHGERGPRARRDTRPRRRVHRRVADGAVPSGRVRRTDAAAPAQRGTRDVAQAGCARADAAPPGRAPARGLARAPVRGGDALALRRGLRRVRARSRRPAAARAGSGREDPSQRPGSVAPRTAAARATEGSRAALLRDAVLAAERRGRGALPPRSLPRPA
jgi:hypothetical protein